MTLPEAAKAVVKEWYETYNDINFSKDRQQVEYVEAYKTHLNKPGVSSQALKACVVQLRKPLLVLRVVRNQNGTAPRRKGESTSAANFNLDKMNKKNTPKWNPKCNPINNKRV